MCAVADDKTEALVALLQSSGYAAQLGSNGTIWISYGENRTFKALDSRPCRRAGRVP